MGEMADYYCDIGIDMEYRIDYDPMWDSGYYVSRKKTLKCNNCGSKNVKWQQYPSGKWFLFTEGKPHKCEI